MSGEVVSSVKRQRVAENKQAPASNTLRLTVRNLPSALEDHVLSFLDMDSVCDLRFLSKDMLQLVTSFVSTTKRALFGGHRFTSDADPSLQPLLRSFFFLLEHARSLREFAIDGSLHGLPAWWQPFTYLKQTLLPALMVACSATLETVTVRSSFTAAMLDAAALCPHLRSMNGWFENGGDPNSNDARLVQLAASCPELEELDLTQDCSTRAVLDVLRFGRPLTKLKLARLSPELSRGCLPCIQWPLLQDLDVSLVDLSLQCLRLLCTSLNSASALTSLAICDDDDAAAPSPAELAGAQLSLVRLPRLQSLCVLVNDWVQPLLAFDAPLVTRLEGSLPACFGWARNMPRLQAFSLGSGEWPLRDTRPLFELAKRPLTEFNSLAAVESIAVKFLSFHCKLLRRLSCELADHGENLPRYVLLSLPELRELRLGCKRHRRADVPLDLAGRDRAAAVLPLRRLELLNVGDGKQLAGLGFPALHEVRLSGPVLADVDLSAMPALQDVALLGKCVTELPLQRLLSACSKTLTRLELLHCKNLWSLKPFLNVRLPQLRELVADALLPAELTALQLLALATRLPQLIRVQGLSVTATSGDAELLEEQLRSARRRIHYKCDLLDE